MSRPLTEKQKRALIMMPSVYLWTQGSLPSLAARGLVERFHYTEGGRRWHDWRLTEAGTAERDRLVAERRAVTS
jgi:hypothetical protein